MPKAGFREKLVKLADDMLNFNFRSTFCEEIKLGMSTES